MYETQFLPKFILRPEVCLVHTKKYFRKSPLPLVQQSYSCASPCGTGVRGACPSTKTSGFKKRGLDLTLSDTPAGNPEYVQTHPAGHILFGFISLVSD